MINRNVPANISRVIMEGLSLSPDKRIRTVTELVDRLFSQPKPAAEPVSGEKPHLTRKEQKQRRERAKTIAVLVFAGIVLTAFVVVFVMTLNGAFSSGGSSSLPETEEASAQITAEAPAVTTANQPETAEPEPDTPVGDTILMPDFSERSYDYENERYGSTFTFVPTYEYSDTYANGMMYDQSIEPGTEVTAGTTVEIKVSKGPSKVALPDFAGKDPLTYSNELSKLNIKYSIKTERSNGAENGYVFKCSVEVGDLVDVENGQEVVVFCAENFEPTAEPTVEAVDTLEGIPVTEEYFTEEITEV